METITTFFLDDREVQVLHTRMPYWDWIELRIRSFRYANWSTREQPEQEWIAFRGSFVDTERQFYDLARAFAHWCEDNQIPARECALRFDVDPDHQNTIFCEIVFTDVEHAVLYKIAMS